MDQYSSPKNELPGKTLSPAIFLEGVSPSMRAVEVVIRELASSDVPVLLLAEVGTGKRTIARRIHESSSHNQEAFRIVACASLSAESFENTGGEALFQEGTIFLDEIGDLSSTCQGKLLEILPKLSENGKRRMKARLICGSARDLEAEMKLGRFREDLY